MPLAAMMGVAELRMFRLFEHLSDRQLSELMTQGSVEEVDEGGVVLTEGDESKDVFVVMQGSFEGFRNTLVGPQPVMRLRPGQLFGEGSFLDGQGREATVTATQKGRLLRLDADFLRREMGFSPEFSVALWRLLWHSLTLKIRQANGFMAEIAATSRLTPERGARSVGEEVSIQPSDKEAVFSRQGLSAAELRLLMMTLPAEQYPADGVIFFEGEAADALYIVTSGVVRISRRLPTMGEEAIAFLKKGEVFGEMALIDDSLRSADARAHEQPCTVLKLNRSDLEEILSLPEPAAEFLALMCRLLVRRLRAMVELLVNWRVMAGHS